MKLTTADRLEDFFNRHKVAVTATFTVVATTAACIGLAHLAGRDMKDFIKDHGLWDEYMTLED
jgi:hypothetical protein